jgi:hypothetical protein
MKSYIGQRPPGWNKKPDQPVIIVTGDEEKTVRDHLYGFSDFWRQKVRRRADQILNRNPFASRVDICSATGEVIRAVKRDKPEEITAVSEERPDNKQKATAKKSDPSKPPKKAAIKTESKRRGRPSGKRSDPDFIQITAYIRKNTLTSVKLKLLKQGEKQDVSELIETLLSEWLVR